MVSVTLSSVVCVALSPTTKKTKVSDTYVWGFKKRVVLCSLLPCRERLVCFVTTCAHSRH